MLFLALLVAHPEKPLSHREERRLERIAYAKCGPDGTVDWDDNPAFPPPHCNRNGWDGKYYRRTTKR